MSIKYILKPSATLFLTAVTVIALLSVVQNLTREPIERQKRRTLEAVKREALPGASVFREIPVRRTGSLATVYEGYNGDLLVGYVVDLSPGGYSGKIDIMVGISVPDERITGMRVLRHNETPGLGALAANANFYSQYDNRELIPLAVTRFSPGANEIQAITSATITARAITNAVNEAMEWYNIEIKGSRR